MHGAERVNIANEFSWTITTKVIVNYIYISKEFSISNMSKKNSFVVAKIFKKHLPKYPTVTLSIKISIVFMVSTSLTHFTQRFIKILTWRNMLGKSIFFPWCLPGNSEKERERQFKWTFKNMQMSMSKFRTKVLEVTLHWVDLRATTARFFIPCLLIQQQLRIMDIITQFSRWNTLQAGPKIQDFFWSSLLAKSIEWDLTLHTQTIRPEHFFSLMFSILCPVSRFFGFDFSFRLPSLIST